MIIKNVYCAPVFISIFVLTNTEVYTLDVYTRYVVRMFHTGGCFYNVLHTKYTNKTTCTEHLYMKDKVQSG